MELSLSTRTVAGRRVLEVGGEIDVYTAPQLRERLISLVEAGDRQIVVDLGRVEFLDSTGLRCLLRFHKRAKQHGVEAAFLRGSSTVQRVFEITATVGRLPFLD